MALESTLNFLPITPILVVVEGETDKAFIECLIKESSRILSKQLFQVHAAGNYEKVIQTVKFIAANDTGSQLKQLALVVDADEAPLTRSKELNDLIAGLVEQFATTALILPSATEAGALESLVLKTLNVDTLACSDAYTNCVEQTASLNTAQRDKLRMYAWTSQQQKEPVTNFMRVKNEGNRVIKVNDKAFEPVVQFLIALESTLA